MHNSRASIFLAAAAAALGVASLGQVVVADAGRPVASETSTSSRSTSNSLDRFAQQARDIASIYNFGRGSTRRPGYPNGPGWTQAQVQRRARKARNVKRNRRAQKRAGR